MIAKIIKLLKENTDVNFHSIALGSDSPPPLPPTQGGDSQEERKKEPGVHQNLKLLCFKGCQ